MYFVTVYDVTVCVLINFQNKQEDIYGNLDAYYAPASNEDEIYSQLQSCGTNNIPHNQIRLISTCTLNIIAQWYAILFLES